MLCSEESYPIKVSYRNAVTWGWNRGIGGNKNPNACVSQGKLTGKWRSVTQGKGSFHSRNIYRIFGTLVCVVHSWIMNNFICHLRFCKSHKIQQFVCTFSVFFLWTYAGLCCWSDSWKLFLNRHNKLKRKDKHCLSISFIDIKLKVWWNKRIRPSETKDHGNNLWVLVLQKS